MTEPLFTPKTNASLKAAIDKYTKGDPDIAFKTRKGFAPSETSECNRYHVYMFRGVDVNQHHPAKLKRMFSTGNDLHERYVKYFEEMGILIDTEKKIVSDDRIPVPIGPAYVDAIIEWGGEKVVELKSISDNGYNIVRLTKRPKDDHYRQIQLYLDVMDMDDGFVIYENKNTSALLIFEIKRDREFLDRVYAKYLDIWTTFKEGDLPKRPFLKDSKQCKDCKVQKSCWADKEVGI